MLLASAIGIGLALLAARQPGGIADRIVAALIAAGVATPSVWLGMLLVLLFALTLRWLPTGGFVPWGTNLGAAIASLLMPTMALALPKAAVVARLVRRALVAAQDAPYLTAVAARGLTEKDAMRRHGWRNVTATLLRPLAIEAATLIAGTVIVENVFYLPGLGALIFNAITSGDVSAVRAGTMVLVLLLTGTLFLIGLCEAWADPRLREGALS
jgi:peptide/nickel transport system permease protein